MYKRQEVGRLRTGPAGLRGTVPRRLIGPGICGALSVVRPRAVGIDISGLVGPGVLDDVLLGGLRRLGIAVLGPDGPRGVFVTAVATGAVGRGQDRLLRGGDPRGSGGGGGRPAATTGRGSAGRLVGRRSGRLGIAVGIR